jgi:dolichyl-phosphate-mannose-protein mannosyltransferase
LFDVDDQGKWMKGYGAGPGVGGRRGLPPRQRLTGWVSLSAHHLRIRAFRES